MPLNAGDSGCTTGLSGLIYSNWKGDANCGFDSPIQPAQDAILKAMCYEIARSVVAHITGNAVVTVTGVQSGGSTAPGTIS